MNTKGLQKIGNVLTKNSPNILTGVGVVGLLTTVFTAIKDTPKALLLIKEEQDRREDECMISQGVDPDFLTKKDTFLLTWKCYVPTVIMGGITIACIISANSINLKRNAALAGLYSLSEIALKEYKEKVVETIGERGHRKIKDDLAKERITKNPVNDNDVVMTGKGETLCFETTSSRYFKSDIEQIRSVFNNTNRDLMNETFISLNQFYSDLGLEGTTMGEEVGWHMDDGLLEPDFSSHLTTNGKPCLSIDYSRLPRYSYGRG